MSMLLPNWSELPEELLSIIAEKLSYYQDFLRFNAVCQSWRSVERPHQFLKFFFWLMLTADEDEDDRSFFVPSENRVYRINLPEARGCHCWGSPNGWLVTLGLDQQLHLLNPLTRKRLPLPPLSTFKDRNFPALKPGIKRVRKASVFTYDENPQCLVVCLIIGEFRDLAFAKPGDTTWSTLVEQPWLQSDMINFNGKIYTIQHRKKFTVFEYSICENRFAALPDVIEGTERFYLVEFGGELHLVVRTADRTQIELVPNEFYHYNQTSYFQVFKLDLSTFKWDELETLGDYAIFLGSNSTTFALNASDYPDQCKRGCIYFTDDCEQANCTLVGDDMGIYNLEAHTYELLYEGDSLFRFSSPVWITPQPF